MDGFGYVCALVLAAVFVTAASAKLARPEPVEQSVATLGLPRPSFLARAVPVAELAVAVLLVAAPRSGGVTAFGVLTVFSAVLVKALRTNPGTVCPCFGSVSARPVSTADLVRNCLLALLAVSATLASRPVVPDTGEALAAAAACLGGAGALVLARTRLVAPRRP